MENLQGRNSHQPPNRARRPTRRAIRPRRNNQQQPNLDGVPGRIDQQQPNLDGLPGRNNQQQPNLDGLSGRNNQQQPDLQHERVDDLQQGHQPEDLGGADQFKLPSVEIPEAELDETKCGICLASAREYKENRRPVARTDCGHFFCIPCIYNWKKRSPNCPYCTQPTLQQRGPRGLYLFHVI
ncbi:hypothetical protein JTE90_026976 [Oedothorax gibbosus]|uniref:RING-type domain-containing protein n=1 Tax=Oedothorax gibbosus TaxID=931172 RepID=A0AAV6U2L6_9ARAC|nr:hypothetical protein JTE90_026976 [Oedothorax gibbosus]